MPAWQKVLTGNAPSAIVVGVRDDRTLIVLCAKGSHIAAQLDAQRENVVRNLNAQLGPSRQVRSLELVEGDATDKLLVELMHSVREDVEDLADRLVAPES